MPDPTGELREKIMLSCRILAMEGMVERITGHVSARIAARSMLRAAADFLGLNREQLRAQLPGTSLPGLAEKQGKSVGRRSRWRDDNRGNQRCSPNSAN